MLLGINSSAVFLQECIKVTTKTPQGLHQMGIPLTNWWAETENNRLCPATLGKTTL